MNKKLIVIIICTLLISIIIPSKSININQDNENNVLDYRYLYQNDALITPDLDKLERNNNPDPGYNDLSEYMIGTIAIGIIFLESDGSTDPSTEDWTQYEKDAALGSLGLAGGYLQWNSWYSAENLVHSFMCYTEVNTIEISYEPIIHPSAITDDSWEQLYVSEALGKMGYTSGDWMDRTRAYSNYLRDTIETLPGYYGTDWAFTVFLVDNSNDADGLFSDGYHAYAYMGGPFTVCPHLRPGGPPGPVLREVFAHEMGHIFYATDEYNGQTDYSGYLNQPDVEGSGCIMDNLALTVSSGSKLQVGWRDTDGDGKADILDTNPETVLNPYIPDPSSDPTPTYTGSATVVPYTNNNPIGPGNDVTTNTVAWVNYRVDGGSWQFNVNPDDGNWDEAIETYTFTTMPLSNGLHTIESKSTNSVGNDDLTPASDTLTISSSNQPPNKPATPIGPPSGKILTSLKYTAETNDPENEQIYYWFDWGDGTNSGWLGPYTSGQTISSNHMWILPGSYNIKVKAKDVNGGESPYSDPLSINIPRNRALFNNNLLKLLNQFSILQKIILFFIK